jgi:hypothetical protein
MAVDRVCDTMLLNNRRQPALRQPALFSTLFQLLFESSLAILACAALSLHVAPASRDVQVPGYDDWLGFLAIRVCITRRAKLHPHSPDAGADHARRRPALTPT